MTGARPTPDQGRTASRGSRVEVRSTSGEPFPAQHREGMSKQGFQSVINGVSHLGVRPQTPNFARMSAADVAHEHGRLTEQLAHKNTRIRQLLAEKEALDLANNAAHKEVAELKIKLRKVELEKAALLEQLDRVGKELDEQKKAVQKANDKISKQSVTIKVQSDQIAQPNSISRVNSTPHHGGPRPGLFNNVYNQPPPAYNPLPGNVTPARARSNALPPYAPPMSRQQSAPPMPVEVSFQPAVPPTMPPAIPRGVPVAPNPSYHGSTQLVHMHDVEPSIDLVCEYTRIFKLTEDWGRNFANVPDKAKDTNLPPGLNASIIQYTNPAVAMRLMSSGGTRYFVVAKLINYQLSTFPLRPMLFKGFSPYYDHKISDFRAQLHNQMPLHVRRAILTASAETCQEMTKQPGFQEFTDRIIANQVHEMWRYLEPLFAPGMDRQEAWEALSDIWTQVVRVGTLMMLKPSTYTLDYPPTGPSSLFNPSQMVSRDLNFRQDPQSLAQMSVCVRLAVTPVISETDFIPNGVAPKTVHYANVLLQL